MSEKRKICIYCETWESGGIESFLHNVLCHMDLSDLEVDIVVACLRPSIFTESLEKLGVQFIELSGNPRKIFENRRKIKRLLREKRYDVLHLNAFQGLQLSLLRAAKRAGIPVRIAHSHNTALRQSATRWLKMPVHRLSSMLFSDSATDLWACSSDAASFMFPRHVLQKKSWQFIPNGIDLERFRFDAQQRGEVRRELGVSDCFVIGSVGRLCYQKNQAFLLDVFAALMKQRPNSRLLLVGEGEDRQQLEEKAAKLGIADSVIFYGVTDHVERLLWAMDAFAFPSRFEGLSIAAVEAQAAGLPVLCSEHIPSETLLTPQAIRVPLSNMASWVRALVDITTCDREQPIQCQAFQIKAVAQMIGEKYSE